MRVVYDALRAFAEANAQERQGTLKVLLTRGRTPLGCFRAGVRLLANQLLHRHQKLLLEGGVYRRPDYASCRIFARQLHRFPEIGSIAAGCRTHGAFKGISDVAAGLVRELLLPSLPISGVCVRP